MKNQEKINNKKILVVEDELIPFELYKSYLKGIIDEKNILYAEDVSVALTTLENEHIELVILNLLMPKTDGFISEFREEGLEKILTAFLTQTRTSIENLHKAYKKEDFRNVEYWSHKMAGSSFLTQTRTSIENLHNAYEKEDFRNEEYWSYKMAGSSEMMTVKQIYPLARKIEEMGSNRQYDLLSKIEKLEKAYQVLAEYIKNEEYEKSNKHLND